MSNPTSTLAPVIVERTVNLDPAMQSEVEVTFAAVDGESTAVRLEHRHIEHHGAGAEGLREAVDSPSGWHISLDRVLDVAEGRDARPST